MDTPYWYVDQVLEDTWATWSEQVLNVPHGNEFDVPRGFQLAFQKSVGGLNSNERTRALELHALGVLFGPLIAPRASVTSVPLGWKLHLSGRPAHTPLGFAAYAIGKLRKSGVAPDAADRALSAVATIFALQLGRTTTAGAVLTSSLFLYLLDHFPRPAAIREHVWNRYLATAMFCTLDLRKDQLLGAFRAGTPPPQLVITFRTKGAVPVSRDVLKSWAASGYPISNVSPPKPALYWIGDHDSANPRGLFTLATAAFRGTLEAARQIERDEATAGRDSPFRPLIKRNPASQVGDALSDLREIFRRAGFEGEWWRTMESLRDGVIASLAVITGGNGPVQRVLFAHDCEPPTSDGEVTIVVPVVDSVAEPRPGDAIVAKRRTYLVEECTRDGDVFRIRCRLPASRPQTAAAP